jgi:dienelactone hydrolase
VKLRLLAVSVVTITKLAFGQQSVLIPIPNGPARLRADSYGNGKRGLVLAHGGRFDRSSWRKEAEVLAEEGFTVLAISFRGDGLNKDGSPGSFGSDADNAADVLAAVTYLHRAGAKAVSAIGGSFGGDAVGNADSQSKPGTFDRVVFLGSSGGDDPSQLSGRKLFLVARGDVGPEGPRLNQISVHYAKAPEPKKLVVVEGTAHAQFLFATEQAPAVMKEIVSFLSEP